MKPPSQGFTLIELAIAVFILALLLGSILVPLSRQTEQIQVSQAETLLTEARDALTGFAAINGYLPCPDRTTGPGANDGAEDVSAGNCVTTIGNLPAGTLGLPKQFDPWSNRLRYAVDGDFARRAPATPLVSLSSQADLRVCTVSTCTTILTNSLVLGDEAAFVVLSHGPNGLGAISYETGTANLAPTSTDEIANVNGAPFVSRVRTSVGSTAGEFDDIVTWVSRPALARNMVAAGKLP